MNNPLTYAAKYFSTCLAACLLVCPALADDLQDSVTNASKDVVVSTNGNCVRTKWQSDSDVCAPAKQVAEPTPAPAPRPYVAPAAVIEKDQRTVYFDFNKSDLRPDALKTLEHLVSLIRSDDKIISFHVVGYVDEIGGESKKNIELSQKRADAVRDHLALALKLPSDAHVKGLGVSHSAECSKKESRKKRVECLQPDRRVEVELTYKKE